MTRRLPFRVLTPAACPEPEIPRSRHCGMVIVCLVVLSWAICVGLAWVGVGAFWLLRGLA